MWFKAEATLLIAYLLPLRQWVMGNWGKQLFIFPVLIDSFAWFLSLCLGCDRVRWPHASPLPWGAVFGVVRGGCCAWGAPWWALGTRKPAEMSPSQKRGILFLFGIRDRWCEGDAKELLVTPSQGHHAPIALGFTHRWWNLPPSLYDLLSFPSLRTAYLLLISLLFLEHNWLLVLSTIWIESSKRVFGNSRLAGKTCGPEKNKKIYIHIHIYTFIHTHMYAFIHIHVRERESLPTSLMWVCVCIFLAGCMWLCVHVLCSHSRPDSSILLYSWAHLKLRCLGHKIIPAEWVAGLGKPSVCPSVWHTLHQPSPGRCCFLCEHSCWRGDCWQGERGEHEQTVSLLLI